jgi:hypothetical protein
MNRTQESQKVRQVLDILAEGIIKPEQFLQGLIIDGFVALEQMIECEQEVKDVFSTLSVRELEKVSSNIFVINSWIQEVMRKGKSK